MGMRKKFFVLAGLVAVIMTIVSFTGYMLARNYLVKSVEEEIVLMLDEHVSSVDGWLMEKGAYAVSAARSMSYQDTGKADKEIQPLLNMIGEDKTQILDLSIGNEDQHMVSYRAGVNTGKVDPRTRGWYKDTKANPDKLIWTEAYKDVLTGKNVVSAAISYEVNGTFRGAICEDIALDTLNDVVKDVRYKGEGQGYIIDRNGAVIASDASDEVGKKLEDIDAFKAHSAAILAPDAKGFMELEKNGATQVFAYATVPSTQWVIALVVPESIVYAPLSKMRIMYIALIIIGVLIIVGACLKFSTKITNSVVRLKDEAVQMAEGNLSRPDISIDSSDEIGDLGHAFNAMKKHIYVLISDISKASERLAASSEQLTASSHQSAEAATHVAENVCVVAEGMGAQMQHMDRANSEVSAASDELQNVVAQSDEATSMTEQTAEAASHGQKLMQDAVKRMDKIEDSVAKSAEVVAKLGENSEQIGQIVETISNIAGQTNLLALNAAIEAARAGEQGRGFSVVADEVRKLAEQSQQAADEISRRIETIQTDTANAVSAMGNGRDEVQAGDKAIRDVGTEFEHIVDQVQKISDNMRDISSSMKKVSDGTERIGNAVGEVQKISKDGADQTQSISAATEEQSASMEEIAAAAHSLAELATQMQEATNKFKL